MQKLISAQAYTLLHSASKSALQRDFEKATICQRLRISKKVQKLKLKSFDSLWHAWQTQAVAQSFYRANYVAQRHILAR